MSEKSLVKQAAEEAARTDEQLSLDYGDYAMEPVDRDAPKGNYTGERFFVRRPLAYKLCAQMLADPSISVRQICAVLHVTDGTVNAVRMRESELMANERKILDAKLTSAIHASVERAHEDLPNASALQAATVGGIFMQRRAELRGEPTQRIEVTAKVDFGARLQQLAEQAQQIFENMKRAEVIEVGPRMDANGRELGQTNERLELVEATAAAATD